MLKAKESIKQKLLNQKDGFLQASTLIGKRDLEEILKSLNAQFSDVKTISITQDYFRYLDKIIDDCLTPFMIDRLSVFAEYYPNVFERHVFCGWLSGLVALKLGLNKEQTKNTVVAALARDIGLLYLPNVLLDEEAKYGPSEWAAMKSHTMVGEIITRDIGELEEAETRGVLEHHERHDGMGYPKGIKGKHLSIIGQIVGAVDTICAIRFKRFEHSGRNLRDVYSYIQMNSSQFNPQVNSALFEILVKSGIERTMVNPFKTVDKLVSHLYVRGAAMNGVMPLMERLDKTLDHFAKGPKRLELQRVNNQVGKLINESGMLDKKMLDWLNSMDSKYDYRKVDLAELSEMELLQNELYWQLKRVSNACQAFHDTEMNKAHPLASDVSTVLRCLSEKNLPGAASYISK